MSPRAQARKKASTRKRASAKKRSSAKKRGATPRPKAVGKTSSAKTRGKRREQGDGDAEWGKPIWSGTLTFGLVSVPVDLYPAVRSGGMPLRMLDEEGAPLERRYYDPETGRDLPRNDVVRGYETKKGNFVVVEDEELEAIAPEKTRDIDLRRFVPREQLDPLYFERAYYLLPAGESVKAYRLLAETMERTGRAGIATFVMRGTEYLTAITADYGILRAETLRFQDEVRTPEIVGLPAAKKTSSVEVARLTRAIRAHTAKALSEKELEDGWVKRLEALVARKKKKGQDVVDAPAEETEDTGTKIIDLLEVLKRSMAANGSEPKRKRAVRGGR